MNSSNNGTKEEGGREGGGERERERGGGERGREKERVKLSPVQSLPNWLLRGSYTTPFEEGIFCCHGNLDQSHLTWSWNVIGQLWVVR